MAIWDAITGRRPSSSSSSSSSSQPSTSTTASSSSSSEALKDNAPSTSFDPSNYQAQDVSSLLSGVSVPDPSQLHPLAGLGRTDLDYITLDESTLSDLPGSQSGLPSRGWSDDLCYGTGITYVTALGLGGAWGFIEGLNRTPASAPPKLRLNSVLNSVTRRGPFLGNSAGVLALVYNGINSTIGYYRGRHDALNSLSAGAISGMLFKSTRGLRPMAISGAIVAGAAGSWTMAKKHTISWALATLKVLQEHFGWGKKEQEHFITLEEIASGRFLLCTLNISKKLGMREAEDDSIPSMGQIATPDNFIDWSRSWAHEMWLCSKVSAGHVEYFDTSNFAINLPSQQPNQTCVARRDAQRPGRMIDGPTTTNLSSLLPQLQQLSDKRSTSIEQQMLGFQSGLLLIDAERVHLVETNPAMRRQANDIADKMLRSAGASQDVIAAFKQVLPYKMAHLDRIQNVKAQGIVVQLQLFVGDASNPAFSGNTQKPIPIYVNLKHDWDEFRKTLETFRDTSKVSREPQHWEYDFLQEGRLTRNSGSDGVLKTGKDFRRMIDIIRDKRNSISALIFQRFPHQEQPKETSMPSAPLKVTSGNGITARTTRGATNPSNTNEPLDENGEPYFQEVTPADMRQAALELRGKKPEDNQENNKSVSPDTSDNDSRSRETLGKDVADGNNNQQDKAHSMSKATTNSNGSIDYMQTRKLAIENYPRQVTMWCRGDGFFKEEEEPFDFPEIPVSRARQDDKALWGSLTPVSGVGLSS